MWNGADTHSVSLCGRLDKTSGYVGPSTNGSQRRRCDDGLSNHPRRQVCGTSGQHLAALVVKSETEEKFTRSNDESVLSVDLVDASSLTTWTILYTTYLGRIIQIFVVGCCGRQSACQLRICLNRYSIGEPSVVLRIQQIHTGRRDQSCIMHHAPSLTVLPREVLLCGPCWQIQNKSWSYVLHSRSRYYKTSDFLLQKALCFCADLRRNSCSGL